MGNSTSGAGKVILSDGSVQEFDDLTVAELMLEHPQHVVVEFRPDMAEKRPAPLPADKKLEAKKVYLVLPVRRGKPAALTSEETKRVLLSANSVLRSRSFVATTAFLPLFARICPAGIDEVGKSFVVEKEERGAELLPESVESRPEFLSRQMSGKGWRPSLDTITEKRVERKKPHWLLNLEVKFN